MRAEIGDTPRLFHDIVHGFALHQTRVCREQRRLYCICQWRDETGKVHSVDLSVKLYPDVCGRCLGEGDCHVCQGQGMVLAPSELDAKPGTVVHAAIVVWNKAHRPVPMQGAC